MNTRGESMIVFTSVGNYNKVIEFAFSSFMQTIDNANARMVYVLENAWCGYWVAFTS